MVPYESVAMACTDASMATEYPCITVGINLIPPPPPPKVADLPTDNYGSHCTSFFSLSLSDKVI